MSTTFIILFVIISIALVGACYDIYRLRQREGFIMELSHELDALLVSAREEVVKNKKLVESATEIVHAYGMSPQDRQAADVSVHGDLSSPEVLASIVTVLVNKLGIARLSMKDFSDIPEGEYVSVYVDTKTQELVLSLDHELEGSSPESPALFGLSPKDDVFH